MKRRAYPTDLTDAQWALIEPLLPEARPGGRPRSVDLREVVNASLYVAREGIHWRALPHDFPPWPTVYHYFRLWRDEGIWQRVHAALRDQVRLAAGREVSPSALILDSQSVKTSEKGGRAASMVPRM
jgi:putative transposase